GGRATKAGCRRNVVIGDGDGGAAGRAPRVGGTGRNRQHNGFVGLSQAIDERNDCDGGVGATGRNGDGGANRGVIHAVAGGTADRVVHRQRQVRAASTEDREHPRRTGFGGTGRGRHDGHGGIVVENRDRIAGWRAYGICGTGRQC